MTESSAVPGSAEPGDRPADPAPVAPGIAARLAAAEAAAKDKRYGEADGICRDLLKLRPDLAGAIGLRGTVAAIEGDVVRGTELIEKALAIQPGNVGWMSTLADLYRMSCRLDEALSLGVKVVRLRPRHAGFLINLAKTHADRGEWTDATRHYIAALAIKPDNANAHLGIGQILLANGDFRPGWIEYEWRNELEQAKGRIPPIKAAQWNGMALPTGRLLLIGDQGFGDTLQFSRYVPMVAARCEEVVVAGANDLAGLLRTVPGVGRIFSRWRDIPGFSAFSLMSSLPWVFGTELDTIPREVPYLRADPDKVAAWRGRVAGPGLQVGLRIGLFWSGRATHPNNFRRSMALHHLRPLAGLPGVRFFSLQKEVGEADRAEMAAWPGLVDLSEGFTDFDETAALMSHLDLVVTVDSAVAHLAGALGRPVWTMLASPSDWRWLLGRDDTPWYHSMRLFRQARAGDWGELVSRVGTALRDAISEPKLIFERAHITNPHDAAGSRDN